MLKPILILLIIVGGLYFTVGWKVILFLLLCLFDLFCAYRLLLAIVHLQLFLALILCVGTFGLATIIFEWLERAEQAD